MNDDEIFDMPAGREMDALVAREIFGWFQEKDTAFYTSLFHAKSRPAKEWWNPKSGFGGIEPEPYSVYFPSALHVIKQLERDHRRRLSWSFEGPDIFTCKFGKNLPASANTAPLAICRAALLVVSRT